MDICIIMAIVFIIAIAVVMYMLLLNASLREEKRTGVSAKHNVLGRYAIYIGLAAIFLVVGLFIGLRGCKADTEVSVPTTIEAVTEVTTEPSEPEETIHIEETVSSEMPSEAPSAPVTDETVVEIDPDELEMLAIVIYQEAGGDASCDDCRRYVADIVLNRIASPEFPNTMYEVLTAEGQYGRLHWTGIKWADRSVNPGEAHAVERAYRIAREVLSGQHSKLYGRGYVWQARHKQGTEGFECCGHWYAR